MQQLQEITVKGEHRVASGLHLQPTSSTRFKFERRSLGAVAALVAAAGAHALLIALAGVLIAPVSTVKTPPRLQMAFVVPAPAAQVKPPRRQDPTPPRLPKPKTKPRPVTKHAVVPDPLRAAPAPASESDAVVLADPKTEFVDLAETTPAAATPAVNPEPAPLVAPIFEADYLNNPKPVYPPAARRLRLQGVVIVRVTVTSEGKPIEVRVATSSGVPILDQAALAAVQTWSFVPARRGSEAIYADVDVPIRFSLN